MSTHQASLSPQLSVAAATFMSQLQAVAGLADPIHSATLSLTSLMI
jgi:hypothetical protein